MRCRPSITFLLAAAIVAAPLSGCATPEELQAAAERRAGGEKQTGTNIAKKDHGNTRVSGASGKDNVDDTLATMKSLPTSSATP